MKSGKTTLPILIAITMLIFINSCKEDCVETMHPILELKLLNMDNINISNQYSLDSILIRNLNCNEPGLSNAYGHPKETTDTSLIYRLGYCHTLDSIRYVISLNEYQNFIDSFVVYLNDNDQNCLGISIVDAKTLHQDSELYYTEDKILITIKQ